MQIDGGCHCGRIRYRAEANPKDVAVCHCTDCQALSGSPFRAMVVVPAESFHIEGEPRLYVKTADSGRRRAQAFCPDCGSAIYAADPEAPKTYSIRLGGVRQRRDLGPPKRQIWRDSALDWATDFDDTPSAPQG